MSGPRRFLPNELRDHTPLTSPSSSSSGHLLTNLQAWNDRQPPREGGMGERIHELGLQVAAGVAWLFYSFYY